MVSDRTVQLLLRQALDVAVDAQDDVGPGLRRYLRAVPECELIADAVALVRHLTRVAAEDRVEVDLEPRQSAILLSDEAQELRRQVTFRVRAPAAFQQAHAGQAQLAHGHCLPVVEATGHRDFEGLCVADDREHLGRGNAGHLRQGVRRCLGFGRVVPYALFDHNVEGGLARCQRVPVAVKQRAAPVGQRVLAVVDQPRVGGVLGVVDDLQLDKAQSDDDSGDGDSGHNRPDAPDLSEPSLAHR